MAKYRVKVRFDDLEQKKTHEINDVIDITKKRANEIMAKLGEKSLEEVKKTKKKKKEAD